MANLRVAIDVDGLDVAESTLDRLRGRASDLRAPLTQIGSELLRASRQQFRTGRGWRRLSAATRARKARQGLDPRRLVATGALERSLTRTSAARVSSADLTFGTTVFYARFHSGGTGRIPRRRPVTVRPAQRRAWREQITDHVLGDARP